MKIIDHRVAPGRTGFILRRKVDPVPPDRVESGTVKRSILLGKERGRQMEKTGQQQPATSRKNIYGRDVQWGMAIQ
jgi:hypothetical protein